MTSEGRGRISMEEFDYHLPAALIAQTPLEHRSDSRLLVLDRGTGEIRHRQFGDLSSFLDRGDLLVINDTRVLPARLLGERMSGGGVEFLLLRELEPGLWRALVRPAKRLKPGEQIRFKSHRGSPERIGNAVVVEKYDEGEALVRLDERLAGNLHQFGRVPLPPYIAEQLGDDERYQTVFSVEPGSAAAPTAGLHFASDTLKDLEDYGVKVKPVTLHVGLDTFRPVVTAFAEDHRIHKEWCSVPEATAEAIAETRRQGHRVVAVGTTVARTLETYAQNRVPARREAFKGMTDIFITPGHQWKLVDAMITNFHLPKSSLLLMVSSFAGRDRIMNAYRQAIAEEYRFFSFGDAMLIL